MVTYKLPAAQKEDENWGCSNVFKEWELFNAPLWHMYLFLLLGMRGQGHPA